MKMQAKIIDILNHKRSDLSQENSWMKQFKIKLFDTQNDWISMILSL